MTTSNCRTKNVERQLRLALKMIRIQQEELVVYRKVIAGYLVGKPPVCATDPGSARMADGRGPSWCLG
jgi:hypothetical protein